MNTEPKKGRGGARPNSGAKPSGIETVTVRIDKRLLNTVTTIKNRFKNDGVLPNDIQTKATNELEIENKKLLKKITSLEKKAKKDADTFLACLDSEREEHKAEIEELSTKIKISKMMIKSRDITIRELIADLARKNMSNATNGGNQISEFISRFGLDKKILKSALGMTHPDRNNNSVASNQITKMLNEFMNHI